MSVADKAGIPGGNSEVIMGVRSEGAAAMDEAAAVPTAIQPAAPTAGPPSTENFEMGGISEEDSLDRVGEDVSLDLSASPQKDEAVTSIFPPASRQRIGEASPNTVTALVATS